jgi:hypothetical protein
MKIYNISWISKNKEGRTRWACSREKKTFRPLYFQISYFLHLLLVLNNFKSYQSAIWTFTKPFSNAKTIKQHPKILNSKTQIFHRCQATCMHILLIPSLI